MRNQLYFPTNSTKVHRDFFERESSEVAMDLLGRVLVREQSGPNQYLRISEVAAYLGIVGESMEEARNKNGNLFYAPGVIGISSSHGHHLMDLGTLAHCEPSCITIIGGTLRTKDGAKEEIKGPGNITRRLGINSEYDSVPINFGQLWIGGSSIDREDIKSRRKSSAPENWSGTFYFKE